VSIDGGADTDLVVSASDVDLNDDRFTSVENILLTGAANINATGTSGANLITGNSRANSLDGFGGADTLIGNGGNDTLIVTQNTVSIDGGADTDLVVSASDVDLNDDRFTSVENILLTGTTAINATGNALANTITGNNGANVLDGGNGADTLQGWATTGNNASDTLTGGSGADLFVLGNGDGNGYGTSGSKALISDFAGGTDYLQLKDYGSGASSYSVVAVANAGSGYTHQLFDINGGGDVLIANIDYSGTDVSGDLLGSKAIFAGSV
jgi:Ca2+-binding RTX toxin-like protein